MSSVEYLSYDEGIDHLTIYKAGEHIVSNLDTGLAVLSLNERKEVVGIEFMGAHKNFGIPQEVLKNIWGCTVEIRYDPSKRLLILNVHLKYRKEETPIVCSYENFDLGETAFSETFVCSA